MKLTKRVLALILAVAMVAGMVVVGAYASVTDYYNWDPETNPYTAKIVTKLYLVDNEKGTETAIEANTSGKYEVAPDDLIRVETVLQTNYLVGNVTLTPAYTNDIFLPTLNAENDYATYSYYQANAGTITRQMVYEYATEAPAGDRDGLLDGAPYLFSDSFTASSAVVGGPYNALKANYPADWKGSGTTATNYLTADGFAQKLNMLKIAFGPGDGFPMKGNAIILVEPEVLFSYYLTVAAKIGDSSTIGKTGLVGQPQENMVFTGNTPGGKKGTANVASVPCYYVTGENEYDDTCNYLPVASGSAKKNGVTYVGAGTTGDIVYEIVNCPIVVVESHGGEEPPAPTVDKTELKEAIDTLPALTQNQATSASWKSYTDALAAANEVYNAANATQDEVDTAKNNLVAAINGVTALGACDYTALDNAIAAYNALDMNAYTPASITASDIAAKLADAQAVDRNLLDDEAGVNQAAINAAATALTNAIEALVPKADKGALNDAIAAASALNEADYTPASWTAAALPAAITAAQAVYNNDNASAADVTDAIAALTTATNALVAKADKTALEAAITAATALNEADYTPASWSEADLAAAITAAQAVKDDDNATVAEVNAAIDALAEAEGKLVAKADKTALQAAINTLPTVPQNEATNASWTAYADALAAANTVNNDPNATQADVNTAATNLATATANVTRLPACNYDALDNAIAAYNALDLNAYTPASITASDIAAKLADAQAVNRNLLADEAGANQAAINTVAQALNDAIEALVAKADKTALNTAIANAQALNEADYTPASWTEADLATVIAAAQVVAADDDATVAEVTAQITAIETAVDKLVVKADKGALEAAIAAAAALNEADYTPASWTEADLATVIAAAQNVYNDGDATDAQISAAITALTTATGKLVAKADKADLEAAIATLPTVDQANATAASWAAYTDALAAANTVLADDNATQDAVDTAKNNLLAAIDGVVALGACDYTALDAAIAAYTALDLNAYTPASVTASDVAAKAAAAQAVARDLINDEQGANQAAINDAATALNNAIAALVAKADKTALNAAIATTPAIAEANATAASWAAYTDALGAAQAIAADDNATQEDVDDAAAALINAINGVTALGNCDYTTLDAAIAAYTALDLNAYTPASVTASDVVAKAAAAQAVARDLINDEQGANQAIINDAATALTNAIADLVLKADKTALNAAIATTPAIAEANATAASWAAYQDALGTAQTLAADDNASQTDVDNAAAALTDAINGVVALGACDYTALDAAIAAYTALDLNAYTPASVASTDIAAKAAAAQAVARDLINDEQGANQASINNAAAALNDAIAALVAKADKTALNAEIAAAPAMDEDTATAESWAAYQQALADAQAVANDDNATSADVENATTVLAAAKTALASRALCDYTALDAALALTPAEAQEAYTASTWAAYADAKAAAEAIARDLIDNKAGTNQASINDAAAALTDAFNALKLSTANVVTADYAADTYYAKGTMTYSFKVNGAASKIQVITNKTGATRTYDRYHEKVTIKSYNADGDEVDYATTEPAYEIWTLDLTLAAGGYTVKAKYPGAGWDAEGLELNLEYATYEPAYTAEAKVGDGDYGKAVEIEAKHGSPVTFKVVTPTDVTKIQLALENGKTSTYTAENAVAEGDTLVWTVTRTFRSGDVGACTVKTKSISGWTAMEDAVITVSIAAAE